MNSMAAIEFTLQFRSAVPSLSTPHRYLLAIVVSLVALVVRTVMAPLWETTAPFALFMFATVITAWFAGRGPAIVTGGAGLLTRLYFDSPGVPGDLSTITWEEAVRLALFGGFVVGTAFVLERMRQDRFALEASIVAARREIEERRRVEAALESARSAAEAANRLKDEFLALVSHELRTPLNAILGWVALLKNGALPADRSTYALEVIQKNAKTQAQLITDLLDIARSITGEMRLDLERLDLTAAVRAVVDAAKPSAESRGIRLAISSSTGPLVIWADLARLQQIVENLLSNAIKFTPDGGEIDVRLTRHGGSAELVVTDSGEGIEPGFAPHLFEPFRQGETGSTRRYGGLGLGLALVRRLVELHGGSVNGSGTGERGARFTVLLPLHEPSSGAGDLRATGSG
jgi:signal transduction histidine kinase